MNLIAYTWVAAELGRPQWRTVRTIINVRSRISSLRCQCRQESTAARTLNIHGKNYAIDDWTNVPSGILDFLPRKLHLQANHPISITRQIIESRFPPSHYTHYNDLNPVVTTHQNFDSLGFPLNHPGRSRSDTYYINSTTCLRTHTSAHQAETFQKNETSGYTITADVYRRDAIDRSHYPVFHQMEGARVWDRSKGDITADILADIDTIPKNDLVVEDGNPTFHASRNPLQESHSIEEVEAVAAHLKRSVEDVVVAIFKHARIAALASPDENIRREAEKPLQVRWIEAYFPFTSPSWELEVFWHGTWLELLGCGVVTQELLNNAGLPNKIGWAFGIGLERIAMLLFSIPDIRLFWSTDRRFLSQFSESTALRRFVPFSKYPGARRDITFWERKEVQSPVDLNGFASSSKDPNAKQDASLQHQGQISAAGGGIPLSYHENDVMQIIRDIGGDLIESVMLVDTFTHPRSGRKSYCYSINYRSLERTIPRSEANALHRTIEEQLVDKLGVELR